MERLVCFLCGLHDETVTSIATSGFVVHNLSKRMLGWSFYQQKCILKINGFLFSVMLMYQQLLTKREKRNDVKRAFEREKRNWMNELAWTMEIYRASNWLRVNMQVYIAKKCERFVQICCWCLHLKPFKTIILQFVIRPATRIQAFTFFASLLAWWIEWTLCTQ